MAWHSDDEKSLGKDSTQSHWLHCIPKSKKITTPRINLTFRSMLLQ